MTALAIVAGIAIVTAAIAVAATHFLRVTDAPAQHVRAHISAGFLQRRYVFPLAVSANRRYLVDQRKRPFLIVGDSPQALIGNLSVSDAAAYIANRKRAGFNALWVDLLCETYTGCRDDGTTSDGIAPFKRPGDLSTPNPAYFARADAILRLAEKAGMAVFLDPIETGGWLDVLRRNGVAKDRAYGVFVGRRYKKFRNIVWSHGNDFQTWRRASDDAVALAVANGIRSVDRSHIQTVALNYPKSGSLDDARWRPVIHLDSAYTHYPTYAKVLAEYNRRSHIPVYMAEASYEFEQNGPWMSKGTPEILRRQEYWSALSGAAGQFYGNHYTWQFIDGWKKQIDTPGSAQFGYLTNLLAPVRWFELVPDQGHRLVTAGYGTFKSDGNVGSSNYVTTAFAPDRRLAISYLPLGGTITVDMRRLTGSVEARWYDPTNGTFTAASGSPFQNTRELNLTAPRRNAEGDPDWALVLTSR